MNKAEKKVNDMRDRNKDIQMLTKYKMIRNIKYYKILGG